QLSTLHYACCTEAGRRRSLQAWSNSGNFHFFFDLFDSIGSLIGIAEQGGFIRDGQLPRAREALLADAIGTSVSALAGNSTLVSYIESAAGVAEGGKTGLANIVTGLLMLLG